jgi:hypothetical protein
MIPYGSGECAIGSGQGRFPAAAEIERNFDFITRGLAHPLDRLERLLQLRLRDQRAAMAGKGIDGKAGLVAWLPRMTSASSLRAPP